MSRDEHLQQYCSDIVCSVRLITEPGTVCLDIESRINDSISPKPDFLLSVDQRTSVITIKVFEGKYKPYLQKEKAYMKKGYCIY